MELSDIQKISRELAERHNAKHIQSTETGPMDNQFVSDHLGKLESATDIIQSKDPQFKYSSELTSERHGTQPACYLVKKFLDGNLIDQRYASSDKEDNAMLKAIAEWKKEAEIERISYKPKSVTDDILKSQTGEKLYAKMTSDPNLCGYVLQDQTPMTYTTPRTDDAKQKFAVDLDKILYNIASFLTEKNDSYGDSALNPKRIFSQASAREAINVRLDDKLSRLINGSSIIGDNDKKDILGYLILDQIAELREKENVQG